jgi:small multidrug resistance pump
MTGYIYLAVAIVAEVVATSSLKRTDQFTRILPTAIVAIGYLTSFYCLTVVLNFMSVGVAYAIWSGLGIVFVTVVGTVLYREIPDLPAMAGMALIIAGVVIMNVFSKSVLH